MNSNEFNKIMERRLELIRNTFNRKNDEYATNNDVFHNFDRAAGMLGINRENALIGFWTKHVISILDICNKFNNLDGKDLVKLQEMVDEKIGDLQVYLVLLEGMMIEDLNKTIVKDSGLPF